MLDDQTMRSQSGSGKIAYIESDNNLGFRCDRRCQHMPVVDVWQSQIGDVTFIACDQGVGDGAAHHSLGALYLGRQIRPLRQKIAPPFLINRHCPARPIKTVKGELQQQIT